MEDFFKDVPYSVTVCDADGCVVYQNETAIKKDGDALGSNLKDCHSPRSWQMICDMLESGRSNVYTITKNGRHKIIHQQPWLKDGSIAGIIELSIELPAPLEALPHYDR